MAGENDWGSLTSSNENMPETGMHQNKKPFVEKFDQYQAEVKGDSSYHFDPGKLIKGAASSETTENKTGAAFQITAVRQKPLKIKHRQMSQEMAINVNISKVDAHHPKESPQKAACMKEEIVGLATNPKFDDSNHESLKTSKVKNFKGKRKISKLKKKKRGISKTGNAKGEFQSKYETFDLAKGTSDFTEASTSEGEPHVKRKKVFKPAYAETDEDNHVVDTMNSIGEPRILILPIEENPIACQTCRKQFVSICDFKVHYYTKHLIGPPNRQLEGLRAVDVNARYQRKMALLLFCPGVGCVWRSRGQTGGKSLLRAHMRDCDFLADPNLAGNSQGTQGSHDPQLEMVKQGDDDFVSICLLDENANESVIETNSKYDDGYLREVNTEQKVEDAKRSENEEGSEKSRKRRHSTVSGATETRCLCHVCYFEASGVIEMKMHMKEHHPDSTLCTNFVKNGRASKRTVLLCPADECSFYSAMFSSLQEHMSCHQGFLQNSTTTDSETAPRRKTLTAPPDGDSSVHQSKKKQKPRTERQPDLEYTCVICVIERNSTLIFKDPEDLRRHTVEFHPLKTQNCFSWGPLNSDKERKG